jgi:di/tricarboxylate transporter
MTPIGYQLNLLAHAKGGYKFSDWPRFGAPLQIVVGVIGVVCCHYFYMDA